MEQKNLNYYIVLYKNNEILPIPFDSKNKAEKYLFNNNLHAYITLLYNTELDKRRKEKQK